MCFKANSYKFNYGRQANKTLRELEIPSIENIPEWVETTSFPCKPEKEPVHDKLADFKQVKWDYFTINDIFDEIQIARSVDLNKLAVDEIGINYIGRSRENNGVTTRIQNESGKKDFINEGNCIIVPMVGDSTCYCFFQRSPFFASQNILILRSSKMNVYSALFINTILGLERFRFSYGRTLTKSFFSQHNIKLPSTDNSVDWQFMENYIKSLPYSSNL